MQYLSLAVPGLVTQVSCDHDRQVIGKKEEGHPGINRILVKMTKSYMLVGIAIRNPFLRGRAVGQIT